MRISGLGGSSRGICGGPWSALGRVYTNRGRQQKLGQNSWTHEKHMCLHGYVVVVQLLSCVLLFATPWTAAHRASLSITNSWSLLIHVHWVGDAIQESHPLSSPSPPAFNLSQHQAGSFLMSQLFPLGGVKVLEFQNQSFQWILISFMVDWFGLLAVQGILKSLLQHHNSKASIIQHTAFFMVQLSHPYMTMRKTIVLTIQTFVGKVMSLLFNMLSRFIIAFLPRSKRLLISWL